MSTKLTTNLFSDSLVKRMLKTECPLLMALVGFQRTNCTKADNRAYTIKKKGQMTFLPKGKVPVYTEDGRWSSKNRQEIRIGSALRQLCDRFGIGPFKDTDFETAVACLQSQTVMEREPVFEMLRGKDIEEMYRKGPGFGSCMAGNQQGYGFDLYTSNPDKIGLLVHKGKKGEVLGRAITYFCDDGKVRVSRIYYTGDGTVYKTYEAYCKKQGWLMATNWGHFWYLKLRRPALWPLPSLCNSVYYVGEMLTFGLYNNKIGQDLFNKMILEQYPDKKEEPAPVSTEALEV